MQSKAGWLIAVVAILFSITGSATAARLITGKQVKNNSLTGKDVRNGSLSGADINGSTLAELRGPAGPAGPAGAAGAPGTVGNVTTVEGPAMPYGTVGASSVVSATVDCPPGTILLGGGWKHQTGGGTSLAHSEAWNAPVGNGWGVILINNDEGSGDELIAVARCGQSGGAATRAGSASAERGAFDRLLDRLEDRRSR